MSIKRVKSITVSALRFLVFFLAASLLSSCKQEEQSHSIYLTYDDGPDPEYTLALLDTLEQYNVKATFFVTGQQAEKHPEIVLQAFRAGHTIANHSYAHLNAKDMSYNEIAESYEQTDDIIRAITGQETILFRAPFLSISDDSQTFLCRTNKNSVGVDMSGRDWETQDPNKIIENLFGKLDSLYINGGVILLHDGGSGQAGTRRGTILATQTLIPLLREQGYTFADKPPVHKMQIAVDECD